MSQDALRAFVLDQLRALPALRCRAMFGGHGLYAGDTFFGILFRGQLFFRVDEVTRARYLASGSGPFQPTPDLQMQTYFEVPVEALERPQLLLELAHQAVKVAAAAPRRPRRTTPRQKAKATRSQAKSAAAEQASSTRRRSAPSAAKRQTKAPAANAKKRSPRRPQG